MHDRLLLYIYCLWLSPVSLSLQIALGKGAERGINRVGDHFGCLCIVQCPALHRRSIISGALYSIINVLSFDHINTD